MLSIKEADAVYATINLDEDQASNLFEPNYGEFWMRFILIYSGDGLHSALLSRAFKFHTQRQHHNQNK